MIKLPYRLGLLAATLTSFLVGCGGGQPQSAEGDPAQATATADSRPAGEPILLYARLEYQSDWRTQKVGTRRFEMSLMLEQPAFRVGQGATARYSIDTSRGERLQGIVQAGGTTHLVSDDTVLDERYEKSARWPELQATTSGQFLLLAPEPSTVGDGLKILLKLHAPVMGSSSAHLSSRSGSGNVEPQYAVPLECKMHDDRIEGHLEGCGIDLDVDAVPTSARNDEGAAMLPKVREALAKPGGEWTMALLGNHFGATTEYREAGHFVQRLSKTYDLEKDGTVSQIRMTLIVWSTGHDEAWSPRDVTPVRTR